MKTISIQILAIAILFLTSFSLKAQIVNIPDANFKKALVENTEINTNGDTEISEAEAAAFTSPLNVYDRGISDLTGIEYFINITELECSQNQLSQLDVSKNTKLTELTCEKNQLSSLDISNNTLLTRFSCSYNELTHLDVSSNTLLTYFCCANNNLNELNISNNTKLRDLYCYNNLLGTLDVSKNIALELLSCNNNKFLFSELLKIKNNFSALSYTSSQKIFSPIEDFVGFEIDYSAEALFDGNKTTFTWYDWGNNEMETDVVSKISSGIYKFLKSGVYYCKMSNTSFPNTELKTEYITVKSDAIIEIPDANFKKALIENSILNTNGDDDISEREASTFTETLNVSDREISDLTGIEYFTSITKLECSNNQISSLNVSKNTELTVLSCLNNQIAHLDINNNPQLTKLICTTNQLSSLDVSNNNQLTELQCSSNRFPFSELMKIKKFFPTLNYNSSKKIFNPLEESDGFEIDYSSETFLEGNETVFTWYNSMSDQVNEECVKETSSGIFKFLKAGVYVCKMTNTTFSEIYLKTKPITINANKIIDIPDSNFKKALLDDSEINTNGDNEISECEAALAGDQIEVSEKNISDLTGISYFFNIKRLYCSHNQLSKLDLQSNTKLTVLMCHYNQLSNLDLSNNAKLKTLWCFENQLSILNLNPNMELSNFWYLNNCFPFSELSKLKRYFSKYDYDTSKKIFSSTEGVEGLEVDYSAETLFEGKATSFTWYASGDNIVGDEFVTQVDQGIFKFQKPGNYYCELTNEAFPNITLTTKDIIIKCNRTVNIPDPNLKKALVENLAINLDGDEDISEYEAAAFSDKLKIHDKDIANLTGIEFFINIKNLDCSDNQLRSLDISKNRYLTILNCDDNRLSFSELNKIKKHFPNLVYHSDKRIFFPVEQQIGSEIDYSAEALFEGKETTFTWYTPNFYDPEEIGRISKTKTGVYKLLKSGRCNCYMTNEAFNDTRLITAEVTILKKEQSISFQNEPTEVKMFDVLELNATASSGLEVAFEVISGDATLTGNTIRFNQDGIVQIRAYQAGNDEYAETEKTLEIQVDYATGINELAKNSLKTYPNPVDGKLTIQFDNSEKCTICIYDMQGKLTFQKERCSHREQLDLSNLKGGMYLMKMFFANKTVCRKIIKK